MSQDIFCQISKKEAAAFIVYEDDLILGFLDREPFSRFHTLLIPKRHAETIEEMTESELQRVMTVAKKMTSIFRKKMGYPSVTILQNNGKAQDVSHFHLHVIGKKERDAPLYFKTFQNLEERERHLSEDAKELTEAVQNLDI